MDFSDEMVFRFVDSMCTFSKSHASLYQIPSRLDSHYITRQESGVLCGSIKNRVCPILIKMLLKPRIGKRNIQLWKNYEFL